MDYQPYLKEIRDIALLNGVKLDRPITRLASEVISDILKRMDKEYLYASVLSKRIGGMPLVCASCLRKQSRRTDYFKLYYLKNVQSNPELMSKRRLRMRERYYKSKEDKTS